VVVVSVRQVTYHHSRPGVDHMPETRRPEPSVQPIQSLRLQTQVVEVVCVWGGGGVAEKSLLL
jgi:hypothetical protein